MSVSLLEQLQDIAIKFQIVPSQTIGQAPKVETIIKVLTDINKSYKHFLEIEFQKNDDFKSAAKNNNSILSTFIKELDLLAVDLNFGSFEISVAPNIVEVNSSIFKDDVLEWKKNTFDQFKNLVSGDFRDTKYMQGISKRYADPERKHIYQPLFNAISTTEYKLNIKDSSDKILKTLVKPSKERLLFYLPKIANKKVIQEDKVVMAYLKVKQKGEQIDLKKGIRDVYYFEELEYDTYPFGPELIKFENTVFILNVPLPCIISFEDDNYVIECSYLNLEAKGESRLEAENAMFANFHELYLKSNEVDKKSSKKAQDLKKRINQIIKQVLEEKEEE